MLNLDELLMQNADIPVAVLGMSVQRELNHWCQGVARLLDHESSCSGLAYGAPYICSRPAHT